MMGLLVPRQTGAGFFSLFNKTNWALPLQTFLNIERPDLVVKITQNIFAHRRSITAAKKPSVP